MNYLSKKLVIILSSDLLTLTDLQSQIEETDQRTSEKQSERDYWLEYINVGSKIEAKEIMNLEKDIEDVKDDLRRNTGQFTASLMEALPVLLLGFN